MQNPAIPDTGRSIRAYPLASGAAFSEGAAVVLTAGELGECGADPALILGFAQHDAGALPHTDRCLVALATAEATFWMQGSSDPVEADVGTSYGIAKHADGQWIVDKTDTVATRLRVEDIDTSRNLYKVRVLAANRQIG